MSQIKFMSSLVMIGIFAIALISFAINFAIDNETQVSLADDSEFNTINNNLQSSVGDFEGEANTSIRSLMESTIGTQTGETEGGTAFKVGPGATLSLAHSSIRAAYTRIFGSDESFNVVITVLFSMLGIVSMLLIWRAWKGNP